MSSPPSFTHCPKCGHAPLPVDQSLPAACPACGLILAKYGAPPPPRRLREDEWTGDEPGRLERLIALVTHVPARVEPTAFWARVVLLAIFAIWGVRLIAMDYRDIGVGASFIHLPLLIFHEAGHVLFMLFGQFMTIAGGTLMQLIMPAVLCGALLVKNRDPFGASIGLWLIGVSLLDIAPYTYDALEPKLMLLGGRTGEDGGHDWIHMLSDLGLLKRAHGIGWLFHKLGALVVMGALAWGGWLLWQQKKHLSDGPVLDDDSMPT